MSTIKHILVISMLWLTGFSAAADQPALLTDEGGWVDRSGQRIPDADDIKSVKGFGAHLIVTPDRDWAAKWETPHDTIPYFSEAE